VAVFCLMPSCSQKRQKELRKKHGRTSVVEGKGEQIDSEPPADEKEADATSAATDTRAPIGASEAGGLTAVALDAKIRQQKAEEKRQRKATRPQQGDSEMQGKKTGGGPLKAQVHLSYLSNDLFSAILGSLLLTRGSLL
jgi:hypothetical protein